MLFEDEGTTFSEFVLAQRLALARRTLCDRGRPERFLRARGHDRGGNRRRREPALGLSRPLSRT